MGQPSSMASHLVQGPQVVMGLDNQLSAILLKYHAPNMLSQVQ